MKNHYIKNNPKKAMHILCLTWTLAGVILLSLIFDAGDSNGVFSQEFITKLVRLYAAFSPVLAGIAARLRKKD